MGKYVGSKTIILLTTLIWWCIKSIRYIKRKVKVRVKRKFGQDGTRHRNNEFV